MTDLLRSLPGSGLATPSGEERFLPPGPLGGETPQGGLAAGSHRPGFEASGAPSCQVACGPVTAHESGGGWGVVDQRGGAEGESGLRRMRPQPGVVDPSGPWGRGPFSLEACPPARGHPLLPSRPPVAAAAGPGRVPLAPRGPEGLGRQRCSGVVSFHHAPGRSTPPPSSPGTGPLRGAQVRGPQASPVCGLASFCTM